MHDAWPEAHLAGVDPAQGMLEVARHLTPEARFYLGSGEALPLEDASVDLALSTISFHHWQDQAAGVREVAACCDLVAPCCSLISPYPPGLYGCFHGLVFTVQRGCVLFLNRRAWMSRRSQLPFRAWCGSPSGRSQHRIDAGCFHSSSPAVEVAPN